MTWLELLYQFHFTLSGWAFILSQGTELWQVLLSWLCRLLMLFIEFIT